LTGAFGTACDVWEELVISSSLGCDMLPENDLTPMMQRELAQAYAVQEHRRVRRADFAAGFIAALLALHSKSSFKAGALDLLAGETADQPA
jgi:hypothetical protein